MKWRLPAAFLLGILAGGIAMNLHIGKFTDELLLSNKILSEQLADSQKELEQLEQNLAAKSLLIVTEIQPEITFPEEELSHYEEETARLEIEKKVKTWLQPVLGSEIALIDYKLIPQIIKGREVSIKGKSFYLKVKMVVISKTIVIFLEASSAAK